MEPDLTLQMLKSWHDPRMVPWLDLLGRAFGKLWRGSRSSVIAKFCAWGVYFMRNGTMPPDAYTTQEAVGVLLRDCEGMEFPATSPELVVGLGLADAAGTRRPQAVSAKPLDPFHVVLAAVHSSFKRNPELEIAQ